MDKAQFIISSRKVIIRRKVASRPLLPGFTKDSISISRKDKKQHPTTRLLYTRPSLPFQTEPDPSNDVASLLASPSDHPGTETSPLKSYSHCSPPPEKLTF